MSEQKAIFIEAFKGDYALRSTQIYTPGPGEVLIKIKAAALNPADWKVAEYETDFMTFPGIVGLDAAGEIVELGEGIEGFVSGDRVFFHADYNNRNSGMQQYAVAPAYRIGKLPKEWSYEEAASIPLALFTAWAGLYNKSPRGIGLSSPADRDNVPEGKYANTPIVILGGSTSVGQMAIQLAKYSGFSPIIVTASRKNESYVKSLGATHVIDRTLPLSSLPSEISKITTTPIPFAFDAAAIPEVAQAGYDILADRGKLFTAFPKPQLDETESSGKIVTSMVALPDTPAENAETSKEIYSIVTSFLEKEDIRPNRIEVLPGGLQIRSAIARYIAIKYAGQGAPGLIPSGLKEQALFEQAASIEISNFEPYASVVVHEGLVNKKLGRTVDYDLFDANVETLTAKLNVYEQILSKQRYLGGDRLTLADLFHLPYANRLAEAGSNVMLEKSNLSRWFNDMKCRPSWKAVENDVRAVESYD